MQCGINICYWQHTRHYCSDSLTGQPHAWCVSLWLQRTKYTKDKLQYQNSVFSTKKLWFKALRGCYSICLYFGQHVLQTRQNVLRCGAQWSFKTQQTCNFTNNCFEIQPAEGTAGIDSYRSCCFLCSASSCNRRSIFSCFFPSFRERDDTLRANSLCFSSLSLCIKQKQDIDKTGRNKANQDIISHRISKTLL